jgi:hypothetical protein
MNRIEPGDLMDTAEVAAHLGVAMSSIRVALTKPRLHPNLAAILPPPLRKVGGTWVWRRVDVEDAAEQLQRPGGGDGVA